MLYMSVYGYIRASTIDQKDTLKVQEDKIKSYCIFKDLKEPIFFTDSGISGSTSLKDRPEGKKLWDLLKSGDTLVVNKLDRISRNVLDFVSSINYFNKNKILFHCLEPNIDITSSFGLFMCHILSSVAELEKNMTVDRVKATIKKRKDNNECVGSIPFGWTKTDDKKLIENETEQKIIKRIKEMKNDDHNYSFIASNLNDLNVLNKKWYPQTIKRILENNK